MADITERHILDMLARRYTKVREGTSADQWVRAEHVRSWLGDWGPNLEPLRIADLIVADRYRGWDRDKVAFHGFEVKVSRADWLAELRCPEKAAVFRPYIHYWSLVVSDKSIVKDGELPEGWGLLVKAGSTLRQVVAPTRIEAEPMPLEMQVSFAAAVAKTASRAPLHQDAPAVRANGLICGACGQPAPCVIHQPRWVSSEQHHWPPAKEVLMGPLPSLVELSAGIGRLATERRPKGTANTGGY